MTAMVKNAKAQNAKTRALRLGVFLLASCAWLGVADAAHPPKIKVNSTVPYLNNGVGAADVRRVCDWNSQLITHLIDDADDLIVVSDENTANMTGRALSIWVTSLQAGGGKYYTRENWAQLRGELKDGEKLVGTFTARVEREANEKTDACKVLNEFAEQLAALIADWADDPEMDSRLGVE